VKTLKRVLYNVSFCLVGQVDVVRVEKKVENRWNTTGKHSIGKRENSRLRQITRKLNRYNVYCQGEDEIYNQKWEKRKGGKRDADNEVCLP
jgi:hypothetical protein